MSIQISVDPAGLSQEQREAVAGFILAFPGKACAGTCGHAVAEIHAHTAGVVEGPTTAPVNELEALQHDHESTLPVAAFGQPVVDEAAAAFGVPAAPLALSTPAIAGVSTVAPPPPANTAPITTTPGVASSVAGVDLDAKGMPWDNRIHAESKGKIADGTWRKKRNLDPTVLATVEAELRAVMGAPAAAPLVPAPAAPIPAPQAATVTTPTAGVASSAVAVPAPPAPAPAAPVAPALAAPSGDARQQFVGLVGRASAAIQAGKVTQAEVNQCCADAGVPALPLLANRLDLVPQVAVAVDALIAARQ